MTSKPKRRPQKASDAKQVERAAVDAAKPRLSPVNRSLIEQSTESALETELVALDTILKGPPALAPSSEPVRAMLAGAAPDDAKQLQALLVGKEAKRDRQHTSDELSEEWRRGGYPYKFRMFRKDYEEEKFVLQTELLKLQI